MFRSIEIDVFGYGKTKNYPPRLHHLVKSSVTEETRASDTDNYEELVHLVTSDLNNYIKSDLGYNIDADLCVCTGVEDKELHIHSIVFSGTSKDLVHFKLRHL